MTNSVALAIGILVLGALAVDVLIYGNEHLIFLTKKLLDLIDWLAFWR